MEANDPSWNERLIDLGSLGRIVSLAEVAEVMHADSAANIRRHLVEGAHLVKARDILPNGDLNLTPDPDPHDKRIVYDNHVLLLPGDILLRQIVATGFPMPAARVPDSLGSALYAGEHIWVIRLKDAPPRECAEILCDFLRSPRVAQWYAARKPGLRIPLSLLKELPVPWPDNDASAAVGQANALLMQLKTWQQELLDAKNRLFQLETVQKGRDRLVAATIAASQRVQAGLATETSAWKIRNLYPHPLAFRWRQVESLEPSYEKYQAILETAEVLTTYLAVMAIVLAENIEDGSRPGYLKTISDRIREQKGGVSFGDWLAVLGEVATGRRFRNLGPSTAFFELPAVVRTDEFDSSLRRLKTQRDANAHGRGATLTSRDRNRCL